MNERTSWWKAVASVLWSLLRNIKFWIGLVVGGVLWAVAQAVVKTLCLTHNILC